MLKLFAQLFWRYLPAQIQIYVSSLFSKLFETNISAHLIPIYCLFFKLDEAYTNQFESESGKPYKSFQDFFRRKFKVLPQITSKTVWPCEGYLCDWGYFSSKNESCIKGQYMDLNHIFKSSPENTKNHYFANIFLHNHNYHRVHSPVAGKIVDITRIPGCLVFLRPWFYKKENVSLPAYKNERLIIQIQDIFNQSWWLALVGGFGVGSMTLAQNVSIGAVVIEGQELGQFNLGSTVCIASPIQMDIDKKYLGKIKIGDTFSMSPPSSFSSMVASN